jgi:hypothetical protein
MSQVKVTIGSVVVHQSYGAATDRAALRHSLEASLRHHLSKPELSLQGRDAYLLRLQATSPATPSNMGAAISNAVISALRKNQ